MVVLGLLVGGFVAGALGRLLVPGRQPLGCLGTIAAGLAGTVIATIIGRLLLGDSFVAGFFASVLGAAAVVWLLSLALGRYDPRWR